MIQKANIKKQIDTQPKLIVPDSNNKSSGPAQLMGSPMFKMAEQFAKNMPTNYKVGIFAIVYLLISGVVANITWIIKLINLF